VQVQPVAADVYQTTWCVRESPNCRGVLGHVGSIRARRISMKRAGSSMTAVAILIATTIACMRPQVRTTLDRPTDIAQLWEEPTDLEQRDLLNGVGGVALAPRSDIPFQFVAEDRSGYSPGYDVRDTRGLTWSVKLGPEAQPEVAVSRLLWAIGYHQPAIYYLSSWTMTGGAGGIQPPGRFRPDLSTWNVVDDWSWYENGFANTRPFKGLVVANLMVNNWDWKTSNNKVYEIRDQDRREPRRIYVVRDLGASLGKTSFPKLLDWFPIRGLGQGSRNDIDDFESQGFIKRVEGQRVEFYYRGIHHNVLETVSRGDVAWTARLMARLSDAQWHDAFRAAGYSDDQARRFVTKIKSKVAEGLKLGEV
jgi:hypothetical protein